MSHRESHPSRRSDDDADSEIGDLFATGAAAPGEDRSTVGVGGSSGKSGGAQAIEREAPVPVGRGWGKGPVPVDRRKFKYDVLRARSSKPLTFTATKVDRLDASRAGDMLHRIHEIFGIQHEDEARIHAFDKALWFQHTVNGASMLQPGRGSMQVDGVEFDIEPVKKMLGEEQRRFFRAFADDIAETNREVLDSYDPYEPVSAEKAAQVHQVAIERGLQKYPHLAHDSSDACLNLSFDERLAVIASKRLVIPSTVNNVDRVAQRVPSGGNVGSMSQMDSTNGGS